ncbi:MAG: hypothetical protein ABIU77_16710 [Ferruginibacter sp.]
MKTLVISLIVRLLIVQSFAQLTNVKQGVWSDKSVWSNNLLPTGNDEVQLKFNIVVDVNATCLSLTLNGHSVIVNSGITLDITGNDNDTILSSYVIVDTTAASPLDTLSKETFTYDSLKRNSVVDTKEYANGVLTNQWISTFFYNGNSRLPFKKHLVTPLLSPGDANYNDAEYFFFYQGSKLIADSIRESLPPNNISVNNYSYTPTSIIKKYTFYGFNPVSIYSSSDTFYVQYQNENIVKQNDTSNNFQVNNYQYSYDSHPNPFLYTQSKYAIENRYPIYEMETFIEEVFATNNALDVNQFYGTYHFHYKNVYDYKPNGYPKIVRFYDLQDVPNYGKGLYFYTH